MYTYITENGLLLLILHYKGISKYTSFCCLYFRSHTVFTLSRGTYLPEHRQHIPDQTAPKSTLIRSESVPFFFFVTELFRHHQVDFQILG